MKENGVDLKTWIRVVTMNLDLLTTNPLYYPVISLSVKSSVQQSKTSHHDVLLYSTWEIKKVRVVSGSV